MDPQLEQKLLNCYDAVSQASGRMLAAARMSDWDGLALAEKECSDLISRLRGFGGSEGMSDSGRRQRFAVIRKILADDAEIRELVQPWLKTLDRLMAAGRNQERLGKAYR